MLTVEQTAFEFAKILLADNTLRGAKADQIAEEAVKLAVALQRRLIAVKQAEMQQKALGL